LQRWRARLAWLGRVPPSLLTIALVTLLGVGLAVTNVVYQVVRKPTELLSPLSDVMIKTPAATWKSYRQLFLRYSTATITPQLLAALAQVESAANPAAHTYWRWNPEASDLFGIYRPASSSVGMYQMTDPAFADAQHYCIRQHSVAVVGSGAEQEACGFGGLYFRVVPGHAIELTAAFLDRSVTGLLGGKTATAQQKQDLATIIHLCGAGPAKDFLRRGFRLAPDAACGDQDPAVYLAQVKVMEREFLRLAAE
jgi:hypothetical protein